jgi:hypothetical protein
MVNDSCDGRTEICALESMASETIGQVLIVSVTRVLIGMATMRLTLVSVAGEPARQPLEPKAGFTILRRPDCLAGLDPRACASPE